MRGEDYYFLPLKKMLLMAKFTALFMLIALLQVSARSYSQSGTLDLKMENVTIRDVFKQIENSSKYRFFYDNDQVDLTKKVNVNTENEELSEILNQLFADTDLTYEMMDMLILVKSKTGKSNLASQQQQKTITGTVTDNSGQPLPGVTVVVKGTTQGTVTNVDGNYSISNIPEDATLVFSFVGMKTLEIPISGKSSVNVILAEESIGVDEVVVVGYGTMKKINLTGALDVVSEKQISNRAVTNVSTALQGISPNLNISQTGWSGEPGGEMAINIRGIGSLSGESSPYILVDGIPMDLNSINPSDIESVTVLKDAAASAIYGSRAPYGVILITTKKGEMNDKVTFEYSNNISFSSPIGLPHMANSLDFATAYDQARVNAGSSPNFTPENYERIEQYMAGEITEETWLLSDGSDWAGNGERSWAGNGNNDWLHIMYDDLVLRQKHDFSIRGGGKNNSYYISAGYWDQPDELKYGDQFYKRYNITANLSSQVTDWLRVDFNSKYIKENNQYFNSRQGWLKSTMYHNFARTKPYRPMVLPNGEFSNISYIPMLNGGKENHYTTSVISSLGAVIEPIKNWVTTIRYNYKYIGLRVDDNNETVYGSKPDESQYVISFPISSYETTFAGTDYQMTNIVTSYNKKMNDHYFLVLAGFEQELNQFNSLWGSRDNVLTSTVPSISTATGEIYVDDVKSHWASQSWFGRLNYNYKEKYLVEFNARYDGSSRFEEVGRWGFFPSVSAGYTISKEEFWSTVEPYINSLKIRASWGSLGNQNVSNYLYLPNLPMRTQLDWIFSSNRPNYVLAPNLVSPDLTWETSTTSNVGLDASFLNNKLNATLDLYTRITTDMFGPSEAVPRTLGTGVPQSNNASLETRGFELSLIWKDKIGNDFSYSVRATLADNISKVTEYNNPTKTLSTWYEGETIGEIWGLTTAGIYQSDDEAASGPDQSLFYPSWGAGDIHYKDMDGDNVITRGTGTADDSGDYSVIGNNSPRYLYGLSVDANWKGFDFNMFWQGVGKRDYSFEHGDMMFFGNNGRKWWDMNVWELTTDYWRPADETNILGSNTDAYYTKPYMSREDGKNKLAQTRWTQSASYLRLKSLTLGYTIPQELTRKVKISNARVFVSGENLITLTSLTKLFDPEGLSNIQYGEGKIHPLRKVYAFGLNVTF